MASAGSSTGFLLGGRVGYRQPLAGYRTGLEPVLLAAAIPARPGERVLEAGTGAGAALLCLAARVPGVLLLGVERDPEMAGRARENFAANGLDPSAILEADLTALAGLPPVHHACANPPWHAAGGTPSPHAAREAAKRASPGLLALWTQALAAPLRRRGTLTLILPAGAFPEATAALAAAGCGAVTLLPLWPRREQPAKLLLVQATKEARGPARVLPGLVLHAADGGYTPEADSILRGGAPLPLGARAAC